MSHTTQKPKSMQLAAELDYRREYEAAHELRTMQARIAELEAAAHHADYKMEGWLCKQYPLEACLYPESKDWVEGDYRDRVELLHTMYESVKSEVAQLKAQLHAIGIGGVGPLRKTDTAAQALKQGEQVAPYTCDVPQIMREAGMTFHLGLPHKAVVEQMTRVVDLVYAEASIKAAVAFAAPKPAPQQEPVAWRVHPFDCGIGSKGAFALTMWPEQVEMWKRKGLRVEPLYTAPQTTKTKP